MQTSAKEEKRTRPAGRAELERLLAELSGGDRAALASLYRQTRGAVYAMALSLLKDPDEAQDVAQDTFVRLWQNAGQYRPGGSPMAWIMAVIRNLSLMRLRKSARQAELSPEKWLAVPAQESAVPAEDRLLLQTALSFLDDTQRQVILLHAVSGLKHREIAALLDLPLSTVLSKYQRGLKKLKILLEGMQ